MSRTDRIVCWITAIGVAFIVGYLIADSQRPGVRVNVIQKELDGPIQPTDPPTQGTER